MKYVILCAGKSTRMYPLTVNRPKSLLRVGDRTIIEHILDSLDGIAKEAVLVVSDGKIKEKIGEKYGGIGIQYARQKEALGTGDALLKAEKFIGKDEKFLVLMGDNLYPKDSIKECVSYGISMLGQKVSNPEDHGVLETDKGFLAGITEKPKDPKSNLVNTGLYVLNERIFEIIKSLKLSPRKEYELTDAVNILARKLRIRCFYTKDYFPITYPWDLLKANKKILSGIKKDIKGDIENDVVIKGEVKIGKNTIVRSGTHIEGPVSIGSDCVIGPNAYIRPDTSIGDHVRFRGEVVNSIIMDKTTAKHVCYLGHSVIGENVNIAAGTVTADYRHDGKTHVTVVKGEKIDTGLAKLGAFIGDNVHTGINTSIYPGRKIWPNLSTIPGEVVEKDMVK
jgi:bifunctional UDP-N-acetylglucosamine pyrophosphorylase/glucosamine-1-phosphate N-acetyltransferase